MISLPARRTLHFSQLIAGLPIGGRVARRVFVHSMAQYLHVEALRSNSVLSEDVTQRVSGPTRWKGAPDNG